MVERRQASALRCSARRARKARRLAEHVCRRSASFFLSHCSYGSPSGRRANAKQSSAAVSLLRTTKLVRIAPLDCFVALLLAMTRHDSGADGVASTILFVRRPSKASGGGENTGMSKQTPEASDSRGIFGASQGREGGACCFTIAMLSSFVG